MSSSVRNQRRPVKTGCHCGGEVCTAAKYKSLRLCWICYRLRSSAIAEIERERTAHRWAELEKGT